MQPDLNQITITNLRGGLNTIDPPALLPDNMVLECENMDFERASVAASRRGAVRIGKPAQQGTTVALFRHLPTSDQSESELVAIVEDTSAYVWIRDDVWSAGTWDDTPDLTVGGKYVFQSQTLHGKQFLAFPSDEDRLHVRDVGSVNFRRCGVATPAAPTCANTGAGSYTATIRYYRVRYTVQSGGTTLRRSEPSTVLSFTPSGSGTAARVTKPAAINEGETHWELEASEDNINFYVLATTAVATTTYDDSTNPADYADGTLSPDIQDYTNLWSPKFLSADEDRLIIAGSWDNPEYQSRVAWTPVYSAPGAGNDERLELDTFPYLDLDGFEGGELTGLTAVLNGYMYAFKRSHIYRLVRTNNRSRSYEAILLTKSVGAVPRSVVSAFDETGSPAHYFWDQNLGPQRLGANGVEDCGRDIRDYVRTVNYDASLPVVSLYYPERNQVWFWVATGTNDRPNEKLVFQIDHGRRGPHGVSGGWGRHTASSTFSSVTATAACLYAENVDTDEDRSVVLKPLIGLPPAAADNQMVVLQADTGNTDNGATYTSTLLTRPFSSSGMLRKVGVMAATAVAPASVNHGFTLALVRDYGVETVEFDVGTEVSASESHVIVPLDHVALSELRAVQVRLSSREAADFLTTGAIGLNGTSSVLTRAYTSSVVDDFSLGGWVYLDSTTATKALLRVGSAANGYGIEVSAAQEWVGVINGATLVGAGGGTVVATTWTHVAIVRKNGDAQLYVNGAPVGSTVATSPTAPSGFFSVGARRNSGDTAYERFLAGRVAHVFHAHRPLAASEIAALYNGGPAAQALSPSILSEDRDFILQSPLFHVYPCQSATDLSDLTGDTTLTATAASTVTGPTVAVAPTPWQVDTLVLQLRQEERQ